MPELLLSSSSAAGVGVGSSSLSVSGLDERVVAQAALDAAEEQLQSLCASHAGTFVSVERRGRATEEALQELLRAIQTAQEKVGSAQRALDQDKDNDHDDGSKKDGNSLFVLAEKHRVRRRTLLQHSSLLELLELPSLMDACVRSSLYEEALSIAAFSNTLERRHAKDSGNAVVMRVVSQIRSRQVDLRRHLLFRLKSQVTMPQCLEVVTALRRLNSIDLERQQQQTTTSSQSIHIEQVHAAMEKRLQVEFLEARDAWLDSASTTNSGHTGPSAASTSRPSLVPVPVQPAEHLLDAIERYRTRVFEVATQFNSIFRTQTTTTVSSTESSGCNTMSLLSMWTARRIHSFLRLLSLQLASSTSSDLMDAAGLRDALEASIFFASSMGQLGADFTPQLGPIFSTHMHALVCKPWKDGAAQLAETLRVCRNAGVASPLVSTASQPDDNTTITDSTTGEDDVALTSSLGEPQPPPRQLQALPPLARFVNAILTGLNELRRCLLPGIFSKLRTSLEQVLQSVHDELNLNERAVLTPGLKGEAAALRETAARFKQAFAGIVEPYVRGSLEAAFGNKEGAERFHSILRENTREPQVEEEQEEREDDDPKEDDPKEESATEEEINDQSSANPEGDDNIVL